MRLDKTLAAQLGKQALILIVIVVAAAALPTIVPSALHWPVGTMAVMLTLTNWVMRGLPRSAWSLAFDAAAVIGAFFFNYLYQQNAPVVSPFVFATGFLVMLVAFGIWVDRRVKTT